MTHQRIHATIWAPLEQLTLADLEDMIRTARMLGANDSCPVWADPESEDDDGNGGTVERLNIGTVVAWRMGGL